MLRTPFIVTVVLTSLTGGCDRSGNEAVPPQRPNQGPTGASERAAAEIDRLRALPYVGYVQGDQDDEEDGIVLHDAKRSYPGYNLYVSHARSLAKLINPKGRVIHRWQYRPSQQWANGELLPGGDFLVVGVGPSPGRGQAITDDQRYILRFNWNGGLLWKRELTAHHDVDLTPRGQLLTLTFKRRIIPEIDPEIPVRDDCLTLLSQDGEVLETLSLYDVLSARPKVFSIHRIAPDPTGGKPWIDLFHCNSVEWMHHKHLEGKDPIYAASNVLICFRHQNRVAIVNWDDKEVLWAWGGKELQGPHDAQVLDSGNILIFDNGISRSWSRVIEMDPLSRKIVWQYRAPRRNDFFSISRGSSQRLPNGNTLIANSDNGVAFEVTPDGEVVWKFHCPDRNKKGQRATIVRMKRYEQGFVERIIERFEQPAQQPTP